MAPWPGRDWPSHEAGLGPSTTTGSPRRTRKRQKTSTVHSSPDNDDAAYWSDLLRRASPTSDDHGPISRSYPRYSTPPLCKKHLASTSLAHKNSSSNRDHWCERYRPLRAAEVLGNEVEATYLRDWLSAMQVGSGRRVIRKVSRPKKQFFDGWIVDDIGLFGCADDEDDDEELPEEFEEPNLPLGERPTAYPPLTARFTNTILLTGPHGCGKSAAVYAVATELDWEVFEVYPGIGKRTGANLMSLVGDVGKNHMVVKGGAKEEVDKKGVIKSFFGQTKTNGSPTRLNDSSRGSVHVTIEMQRDKANGHDEVEFRQSLILIDEADILYAEEYTFWPAVVALIAESRRPVILTCNGEQNARTRLTATQILLKYLALNCHFRRRCTFILHPHTLLFPISMKSQTTKGSPISLLRTCMLVPPAALRTFSNIHSHRMDMSLSPTLTFDRRSISSSWTGGWYNCSR